MNRVNLPSYRALREFATAYRRVGGRMLIVAWTAAVVVLPGGIAVAEADDLGARSSVELLGITFVSTQRDGRDLIVRASRATLDPDKDVVVLQNMRVEAIPSGGDVRLGLRCQRGTVELSTGDFFAEGDVRGKTSDGRRIETDWARYDDKTGVVSTDASVLLVDRDGVLQGGGFRYSVVDGSLKLTGGTRMIQGSNNEGEGRE